MKLIKDLGTNKEKNYKRFAIFECPRCKKHFEMRFDAVKQGQKKCRVCTNKTHGDRYTRLYNIWRLMIARCYREYNNRYYCYGAVGVTVCDEWKKSYTEFRKWSLSNGYTDLLDLDKDKLCNELNIHPSIYSPKTCIWVTKEENNKIKARIENARKNKIKT